MRRSLAATLRRWRTRPLYRGPLLEECAEEWVFQERQEREQEYLAALEKLAAGAWADGDRAAAERWLRLAVATDPLRESAHRTLMQILAAGGNYAAALLAYRELRVRLHRDLNAEPDPQTQALFQRLRAEARENASANHPARSTPAHSRPAAVAANGRNGHTHLAPCQPNDREELSGEESRPEARPRCAQHDQTVGRAAAERKRPETIEPAPGQAPPLPRPFTRFFGRRAEIAQLCDAIGGPPPAAHPATALLGLTSNRQPIAGCPRLITLTGAGGSGKTRLALEVARALWPVYEHRVYFVPLVDLTDPRLLPDRIRDALGLPRPSDSDSLGQVTAFLSQQAESRRDAAEKSARRLPWLLLLDNLERLLAAPPTPGSPAATDAAAVVWTLLQQAEGLQILATSRQPLGLPGEREFPVMPLPVPLLEAVGAGASRCSGQIAPSILSPHTAAPQGPDSRTPQRLDSLAACPSVALFLDRAQAVKPDFHLTENNAAAVAGLCRRLEGIPLAIELAAARARVLTPAQMLERLECRFDLLVHPQRAGDPRHHTLRLALDWSYRLLPPELQRFFAALSVFRSGWSLEAAEAVCGEVLGRCALDAGNAAPDPAPGARRPTPALGYLEELQQCSLVISEALGEAMRYRLLETLREYGAEHLAPAEQAALAQRHHAYYAAWTERNQPSISGQLLPRYLDQIEREQDNLRAALDWMVRSGAALEWVLNAVEPGGDFIPLLSHFWTVRGYTPEARRRLAEILALPGAGVPTVARAWLLFTAGDLAMHQGDPAAGDALVQESLRTYRTLGHIRGELACLELLSVLARDQADYARAESFHEQHVTRAREIGGESEVACALFQKGYTAYLAGEWELGRALLLEGLQILRRLGDQARQGGGWACPYLRKLAEASGDDRAHTWLEDNIAPACGYLGEIADARGDYAAARAFLAESLAIHHRHGGLMNVAFVRYKLGRVEQHHGQWTTAAAHYAICLEIWQPAGSKHMIAGCLEGLAEVLLEQGAPERAARLLGMAAPLRERRNLPLPPVEQAERDRVVARTRAVLGEPAFRIAWAQGRALPLDHAIAEALLVAPKSPGRSLFQRALEQHRPHSQHEG